MSGTLIYTIGLPGSGKSTWARQQLQIHPGWIQIELDQLREELAIEPNRPDAAAEKQMLQIRDERLLASLRLGKTVIASDTNLSEKSRNRLESIAAQTKASVRVKDFTHICIEDCIERDRNRSRCVGESVIQRMYSYIRPDDPIGQHKTLVIGDVHGDYERLLKLLRCFEIQQASNEILDEGQWHNPQNYFVVFVGDLNDPRLDDEQKNYEAMSSFKCLTIARGLQKQGFAEVIQSNHQTNLINLYYGRRKDLSYGLVYTKAEMEQLPSDWVDELINWLQARPYFYQFKENNQHFICVHAAYTPGMRQYQPESAAIAAALYGLKTAEETRLSWWELPEYHLKDSIVIAGHYHVTGMFPSEIDVKAILIDGECGNTNGSLIGLTTDDLKMTVV